MSSSSRARRAVMRRWFGTINWVPPLAFLFARGYTKDSGLIIKPCSAHNPSAEEVECLMFLREEWDFDFMKPLFQPLASDLEDEA